MSDTPETNHIENGLGQAARMSHPILWAHSRRLERERDKAREEWGKASMDAAQLLSEKTTVMAERDEALEQVKRQAERIRELEGAGAAHDRLVEELAQAFKDRLNARRGSGEMERAT